MKSFRANGKLLITGEYLALCGAKVLALPLKFGQRLDFLASNAGILEWYSYDSEEKLWFEGTFDLEQETIITSSNEDKAGHLLNLLIIATKSRSSKILSGKINTWLEFDPLWGWGTSSTLISLIAQLSGTNPYILSTDRFNGSQYDIACATSSGPILYSKKNGVPELEKADFEPIDKDCYRFIYLGKKQNSHDAISSFNHQTIKTQEIEYINQLTQHIVSSKSVPDMEYLLQTHENYIAKFLNCDPIQKRYFPNFLGAIKSLGAWGGDYILAVSAEGGAYIESYFSRQNMSPIFKYDQIVLNE